MSVHTYHKLDAKRLQINIETRAVADLSAGNIFGASALVRQNGTVIYENCFGSTAANGTQPVTFDTIYRLASMTKPITAVAVMQLVERGLIALDDPVETYLPQFSSPCVAVLDNNAQIIDTRPVRTKPTIRHLLTHTSGIGSGVREESNRAGMTDADRADIASMTNYYAHLPLSFEPFTKEEYSGIAAFDVLAAIIEHVTQESYDAVLRREVFEPCCMENTVFVPTEVQKLRVIAMHTKSNERAENAWTIDACNFEDIPCTHLLGGAGLLSTLHDYSNFAEMLLNDGCFADHRIISAASVREIATPHVPAHIQPGEQRWGLGVRVITDAAHKTLPVGTYGWSGAYGTHFWVDPVNRITAVYMKNSRYDGGAGAVTSLHFEEDVSSALVTP